jgi:hypothetical protein
MERKRHYDENTFGMRVYGKRKRRGGDESYTTSRGEGEHLITGAAEARYAFPHMESRVWAQSSSSIAEAPADSRGGGASPDDSVAAGSVVDDCGSSSWSIERPSAIIE